MYESTIFVVALVFVSGIYGTDVPFGDVTSRTQRGRCIEACEVLGVENDFTEKELKKNFHRLLLKYHPDKVKAQNPDADDDKIQEEGKKATDETVKINGAYETLSNYLKKYPRPATPPTQNGAASSGSQGPSPSTPPQPSAAREDSPNTKARRERQQQREAEEAEKLRREREEREIIREVQRNAELANKAVVGYSNTHNSNTNRENPYQSTPSPSETPPTATPTPPAADSVPPTFPTAGPQTPSYPTTYTTPKSYSPGSTYTPAPEETYWQGWEDMPSIFKDIQITVITEEEEDVLGNKEGTKTEEKHESTTEENQEGTTTERHEYIYVGDNERNKGSHNAEIQEGSKENEGSKNDQIQSTDEANIIKTHTTTDTTHEPGAKSSMMESTPTPTTDAIGAEGVQVADTTTKEQDETLSQPKVVSPEAPETKQPIEITQKVRDIFARSISIVSSIISTIFNSINYFNPFKSFFS